MQNGQNSFYVISTRNRFNSLFVRMAKAPFEKQFPYFYIHNSILFTLCQESRKRKDYHQGESTKVKTAPLKLHSNAQATPGTHKKRETTERRFAFGFGQRLKKGGEAGFAGVPERRGGGAVGVGKFETVGLFIAVDLARLKVGSGGADGEADQAAGALFRGNGEKVFQRRMIAEADEGDRLRTEIRADDAGLERDGADPSVTVPLVQFAGEENIAEFRPTVGAKRRIVPLTFGVGGVEVGAEEIGGDTRGLDHRGARRREFVKKKAGQKIRGKQIDLKGALKSVNGQAAFLLRAAGVVGKHVDTIILPEFRRQARNVGETRVIGEVTRAAEFGGNPLRFFGVTPDDNDTLPRPDESARRGGAYPVASARDNDRFSVFDLHEVSFSPQPKRRGRLKKCPGLPGF